MLSRPTWEGLGRKHVEPYRLSARAAVEAMRIPTEKMLSGFGGDLNGPADAKATWEDMIDLALSD